MRTSRLLTFSAIIAMVAAAIVFSRRERPTVEATVQTPQSPIDSLALLAKHYPSAPQKPREEVTIVRTADGFEPRFGGKIEPQINVPGSRWKNPAKAVLPKFPKQFNNPVSVSSTFDGPRATGKQITYSATAVPLNASASSVGEIAADGTLVYRDAFGKGIDVIYRVQALKTEEFIVVRERESGADTLVGEMSDAGTKVSPPLREFSWNLSLGEGDAALKPRLTPMQTVELCDDKGVPRLRIDLPEGKDADGKRLTAGKELRYTIDGSRLTLVADLSGAKFPVVIDPSWSSTGTMAVARYDYAWTDLADSRVLVCGGTLTGNDAQKSAELFDPNNNTWSAAGLMNTARNFHTATLLPDGKVLVAGGMNSGLSCEVYVTSNGNWTNTGDLLSSRFNHTATLLVNGEVLAVGGQGVGGHLSSCERYNPNTGMWATAMALNQARMQHTASRLANGSVLVAGGREYSSNTLTFTSAELYDSANNVWIPTGELSIPRAAHSATVLADGRVLISGGNSGGEVLQSEVFDFSSGLWSPAGSFADNRSFHQSVLLNNEKVLIAGTSHYGGGFGNSDIWNPANASWSSTTPTLDTHNAKLATKLFNGSVLINGVSHLTGNASTACEIYNTGPVALPQTVGVKIGSSVNITLASDSINDPLTFTLQSTPSHGVLSGTVPNLTFTPNSDFIGSDSFIFSVNDGVSGSAPATVTINLVNESPLIFVDASPQIAKPKDSIAFTVIGTDPEGESLNYVWQFGDGGTSTDKNPTHSFEIEGNYTIAVTATDLHAGKSTAFVNVIVSSTGVISGDIPIARIATSEIVGFVGVPLTFDAIFSTDPNNNIVSYSWDFGDGSPPGSGQTLSKIFNSTGAFVVVLTVTDATGNTDYAIRTIEVLPADQAGLFNGFVSYKVRWDRDKEGKDTLQLAAQVNVGEQVVGAGTLVALDIVGQHFEGTLDLKLRDKTDPDDVWQVKANLRNQPLGTVLLKVKIKNADLGLGFNQAGAVKGADANDLVDASIPVRITVGARSFELNVGSEFKFNSSGKRAKGEGDE